MEIRFQESPKEVSAMSTAALRKAFLIEGLMENDTVQCTYSHYDRMIVGGAKPLDKRVALPNDPELRADYFLERREIGIINVGGDGAVEADGELYQLGKLDCLYLGKGTKTVYFESRQQRDPAVFYLLSAPAHQQYPNRRMTKTEASSSSLGSAATSNKRTIHRYIHQQGIQSCQLVMGLTILEEGSVWNTMPAHTHTRRMEAYFYFDVPEGQRVFHLMGEPTETRHLVIANHQAVVSPPWSVHAGCGTASYGFIWGMAGENYTYEDMDAVAIADLR